MLGYRRSGERAGCRSMPIQDTDMDMNDDNNDIYTIKRRRQIEKEKMKKGGGIGSRVRKRAVRWRELRFNTCL